MEEHEGEKEGKLIKLWGRWYCTFTKSTERVWYFRDPSGCKNNLWLAWTTVYGPEDLSDVWILTVFFLKYRVRLIRI